MEKEKESEYIFGIRAVIEAIDAGKTIEKVFIKKGLRSNLFSELYQVLKPANVPFQYVPIERINSISRKNHQGVIALVSPIDYIEPELFIQGIFESGKVPLILVLDKVSDVRNFGAISRSAECGGVDLIITSIKGSALLNADAIKTSAGALYKIPVARVKSLTQIVQFLLDCGIQIVAATEKASKNYYEADLTIPTAIVMGSEEKGVSREIIELSNALLKIPMKGSIASLNVSVATSLFIFEAIRQREIINK